MVFVAIARSLPAFPRSRPVYRQGRSGSGATGQADRPRNRSLSAFALTVGWSAWFLCWTKAMPVSEPSSKVVYEALRASGVRLVSALPETWLVHLIRMADDAEGKVAMAMTLARASLSPVALLLSRGLMWEEPAA